jgi:signal transduction histidine kinase
LRLLAKSLDAQLLMLLHTRDQQSRIEEVYPPQDLGGYTLKVPDGLVCAAPTVIDTQGIRLALQWTEASGARPSWLAASPIESQGLHLVAAGMGLTGPDQPTLVDAAAVLEQLLQTGSGTQRDRDISRRISALVNNLPAPLVFADSGNVEVFLNDPARHLLGLASGAQLRPPIVAQALARLVRGAADLGNDNADLILGTEGHGFEIDHHGVAYKVQTQQIDQDGLAGRVWLFTDVTREKAFRLELGELTGLLQLTVENVSQGVALVGADLRMMLWNESFIELLGYPREAVYAGADFLALARITAERGELGGEGVDAVLDGLRASLRSSEERTLELRRDDGRVLDIQRKSLAGGRFILTARDKTDEHRAARLKDELVSTVSHELRTPLTSISGALALLKSGKAGTLPPAAMNLLEIAHRNSERLGRLVNDLLDMDKLELGKAVFNFAPLDLRSLLWEAAMQSEPYAERFGVSLELDVVEEPVVVQADSDRLMQVMSNLISNAAKFSPAGAEVTLRLRVVAAEHAVISVIDRGRGISPEFRKRLFSRFAQESGPSERGQAGTGLGLAISKAIVERHGGTIDLDPDVKVGSTFRVTLPLSKTQS